MLQIASKCKSQPRTRRLTAKFVFYPKKVPYSTVSLFISVCTVDTSGSPLQPTANSKRHILERPDNSHPTAIFPTERCDSVHLQCLVGARWCLLLQRHRSRCLLCHSHCSGYVLPHPTMYICTTHYTHSLSLSLSFVVPPVISVAPEHTYTPIFGDQLSITCDSTNTLVSEWIWYHDGVRIPNSNTFEITTVANTLTIGSAHNKEHDGLYQCFAYNDAGNDSATTSVRVTSKCVLYCVNQPCFRGSHVYMHCMLTVLCTVCRLLQSFV